MLVELLQPLGPELVRRWVATLLMVPRDQREGVVAAVEQRIAEMYEQSWTAGQAAADSVLKPIEVEIVHPPQQREGYVEQVVTTYEETGGAAGEAAAETAKKGKPGPRTKKRA
ncbi:hypothetical protein LBMAG48_21280 [Phycisphaerae bacterium]|jgi:hypothetical protein|nr:hypothetical protein LBMAG48_21280 [Phycisphaerae bacterium]